MNPPGTGKINNAPAYATMPTSSQAYSWTGTYAGVQIGGGTGTSRRNYSDVGTTTGDFGISSITGGLTAGHNEQFGHFVAGLEADFSVNSASGSANQPNPNYVYKTENPWYATLRPRLGYAFGNVMPFVTGGLAIGNERVSAYTKAGARGSDFTRTEVGWTAGTGVEAALTPNWSVKAEYLYVKLSDAEGPSNTGTPSTTSFNEHIGRLGLNYKFGQPTAAGNFYTPASSVSPESRVSLATLRGIELGGVVSNYRYQEHVDSNSEFMHETGVKYGMVATATQTFHQDAFVSGDFRFSYSSNDYSSKSGSKSDVPDYLFDTRILAGKDFFVTGPLLPGRLVGVSPYIGIGYRYLYNDLRGTTASGARGYQRDSQYLYLPVGVTSRFRITDNARVSVNTEYDQLIEGWQESDLKDVSSSLSNVTNAQLGGYGLRGSVMYERQSWSAGPFFNYWNINRSNVTTYDVYEPHNQTIEYGLQARYRF